MSISRKQFLKQTGFACASTMLPFSKLFSSESKRFSGIDTQHPKNCSLDLRNPLPGYTLNDIKDADFTYYKLPAPGIAKDILYKHEADDDGLPCIENVDALPDETCDVTDHHYYGLDDPNNNISILRYHAYYPKSTYEDSLNGHDYDSVPLPCLVIFHPGGFRNVQVTSRPV